MSGLWPPWIPSMNASPLPSWPRGSKHWYYVHASLAATSRRGQRSRNRLAFAAMVRPYQ